MNGTAALGDGTQLYRRLQFGDLAEISMLDLRSYRDKQLAAQVDPSQADPARTVTGRAQMTGSRPRSSGRRCSGSWSATR